MHDLGRRPLRLWILLMAACATLGAVALWGGGATRPFVLFVVVTALAVVLATLLEPAARRPQRRA